jgi:hypothetical protein
MSPFGYLLCLGWLASGLIVGFAVGVSISSGPARAVILWSGYLTSLLVFLFQHPGWDQYIWFFFMAAASIGWTIGFAWLPRRIQRHDGGTVR